MRRHDIASFTLAPGPHDEEVEAACFDAKIRGQYRGVPDDWLDMSKQVVSYVGDGPPHTRSNIRMLVYEIGEVRDKTVLDLGCGTGDLSVILAKRGARVKAVDVSPASVEVARRRAKVNHVSDLMSVEVMSAYNLMFTDSMFDFVVGKAILHHLDLEKARNEVIRVLKPGGQAYFIEPMLFSRALGIVRRLIPIAADRDSPDERQLSSEEVRLFCQGFSSSRHKEMGLISSRVERFFPGSLLLPMLFGFDYWALEYLSWIRKYADTISIIGTK